MVFKGSLTSQRLHEPDTEARCRSMLKPGQGTESLPKANRKTLQPMNTTHLGRLKCVGVSVT